MWRLVFTLHTDFLFIFGWFAHKNWFSSDFRGVRKCGRLMDAGRFEEPLRAVAGIGVALGGYFGRLIGICLFNDFLSGRRSCRD